MPKWFYSYKPFGMGALESITGSEGFSFLALLIVVCCTVLVVFGMEETATFTNVITAINLAAGTEDCHTSGTP